MLFDTPVYFAFLLLVVLVYWCLKRRSQNLFLLFASYFFYAWWDWRFVGLLMGSTLVDFFVAKAIERAGRSKSRKPLLLLSLAVNLGILAIFKYFNFFVDSAVSALSHLGLQDVAAPAVKVILPLGISFYTFQEIAYVVDVYHRKGCAFCDRLRTLCESVPAPDFRSNSTPTSPARSGAERWYAQSVRFFDGIMLIVFGLFRKCVIADNFATVANAAFRGELGHGFGASALASVAFAFRIYGDFSGYTDLARGSAKLLGFEFMVNFRQPYLAASLRDFWRRWHISLSTWLRDYLYVPLGGNSGGRLQTTRNLMTTMLLGGLWHGANWTFLVWGGDSRSSTCH